MEAFDLYGRNFSGMTFMMAWIFVLLGLLFLASGAFLWRRAAMQMRRREQLWHDALRALARRDYEGAQNLADRLSNETNAPLLSTQGAANAPDALGSALRATAAALKTSADEQEGARRNLEDVLAALQDAVLVVDGEAHLRYLNHAALQLFKVRVEDVLGASLLEALPSFDLDSAVRAALQEGVSTSREVGLYASPLVAQNGQNGAAASSGKREILLRVAPVRRGDGLVSGAVAILQDLTEMRRLERVRREFVANASHELRTPIANIRAGAETILSNPHDAALAERFLPHLVTESERLSRLVTDLLDLARAETTVETTRTSVDLAAVARGVVSRLKDKAFENTVSVYCDFDERVRVPGDAASLEQVIFNLLDNALMYTPARGHITLCLRTLENSADDAHGAVSNNVASTSGVLNNRAPFAQHVAGANGTLLIDTKDASSTLTVPNSQSLAGHAKSALFSITDTGIGIPAADQERVFERFYRVDKARSRTQGGTGLGLAIVKHIVENHGGHVTVQSEAGQGTTFNVTLPAE